MKVAIDLTQIDNQTLGWGQYRYAVDLANGLARLAPDVDLTLLGSTAAPRDEFRPALHSANVHYARLPPYRGVGQFYYAVTRLAWWLLTHRVDVFHQLHTYLPFPKVCPSIVTAYHYYPDPELFATRPYRYYQWSLAKRADLVIAISDATRGEYHERYGISFDRLRTVYPGLSPSLARASDARRQKPYLLSPYNLMPSKNLRSLVLAWPAIASRYPDAELVLYGRAHVHAGNEGEFDRLLAETRYADRIVRTGVVEDAELASLFAGCELFVFPTTVEGFGYPLVEAMAHGACCVTRNASAMKEVGGDTVCLIETLEPAQVSGAVIDLLGDPDRRVELGERAAERARQFTIERMIAGTVECYRLITSRGSGARPRES